MTTVADLVTLTTSMVLEATGGRLVAGDSAREFSGVSTDTRTISAGTLFVALRGERFDGHAFVSQAIASGAAGVIVDTEPSRAGDVPVIVVRDTLRALQAIAHQVRRESGSAVVAVTGSAGKTSTKEIIASLLAAQYRVYRNPGNFNNHIGLPLSLMALRERPEIAVVELGMNHPGEIRALVAIAEPDVRVWTNVGDAHVGHFGSREAIAEAKAEILEGATARTLVVANADDPLVMKHVTGFAGRVVRFGESESAGLRATAIVDRGFDGTAAEVATPSGVLRLSVPLPGRVHLSNVLAAVAVALEFRVAPAAIESRVAALRPVARRGASTTLPNGTRVVDDSYNASPAAVDATLAALAATPTAGRRVAVLGEMLELADLSPALHESCGRSVARGGIDVLVAIGGPNVDHLVAGALAGGFPRDAVHRFPDSATAAESIAALVAPGDLVLVKGSRGSRTDVIADRLLAVA